MALIKQLSDRALALTAGLLCVVLVVILSLFSSQPRVADQIVRPSSFYSDASGTRACFLVLEALFPSVERWRQHPAFLTQLEEARKIDVVLVLGPRLALTRNAAESYDSWVAEGGWLIVAADRPWTIARPLEPLPSLEEETGVPQEPEDYLRMHGFQIVARSLEADVRRPLHLANRLQIGEGIQVLLEDSLGVQAAFKPMGEGRLIVLPDALAFSNNRLKESPTNMAWLAGALAEKSGGVVFDEFHHGFGRQRSFPALLASFSLTPWGWVCLQLLGAGILYLVGTRRRFGEVSAPLGTSRRTPLALIEARAGLFEAARARRLALELIERHEQHRGRRAQLSLPRRRIGNG